MTENNVYHQRMVIYVVFSRSYFVRYDMMDPLGCIYRSNRCLRLEHGMPALTGWHRGINTAREIAGSDIDENVCDIAKFNNSSLLTIYIYKKSAPKRNTSYQVGYYKRQPLYNKMKKHLGKIEHKLYIQLPQSSAKDSMKSYRKH